jgi:ribosomal-protein-alanine N-acetyltransferase
MEKLGLRSEGVALGYLEINGEWEDHVRYAMTFEEWRARGPEMKAIWLKRN